MGAESTSAGGNGRCRLTLVSWPVLLALILLVLCFRSYGAILHPTLRVEDGAKIYAYFHDHRGFRQLFRFKSGYMPLLPNVLGYLSVRLPPPASPYFMAVAPTLLSAFAYSSFFFRRFRAVVEDDGLRFVTCLALVFAPVGQFFLVSHTDFSIWNALFCAVLWAWVPLPDSPWRTALAVAGQQLLVWTHPISFVAAPINAAQAWYRTGRVQRIAQGAMLAGHALHLALGLDHSYARRTVDSGIGELPGRLVHFEHKALARALFGRPLVSWLSHGGGWVVTLATAALLAGALWVAWRNVARLRLAVVLAAYCVTGLALAVAASRSGRQIDHGIRYLYVQLLFAVMLIAFVVHGAWHRVSWPAASALPRRWPTRPAPYAALVLLLFGLQNIGMADTYRERDAGDNAERVATCMQRLAALHERNGGPCGFSLTCRKSHDWTIVFHPPECRGDRRRR